MKQALKISHEIAEVIVKPTGNINVTQLEKTLRTALDQLETESMVPASVVHAEAKKRFGAAYQSPGYYLRLYRLRSSLTQVELARKVGMRQHHLSEVENNKRSLGKSSAQKLGQFLNCDYRLLL